MSVLIWNRTLSRRFAVFTAQRHRKAGRLAGKLGWDDPQRPFTLFLHRALVILLGILLLIMSFHSFFGTIYTGSAQPPDTILYQSP
jgi:hypothetical protein